MKKQKLIIADILALILSLITIYLPLFADKPTFLNYYYMYIVAYFAVIFSNKEDLRVFFSFIPLVSLSFLILFLSGEDFTGFEGLFASFFLTIKTYYRLILSLFILYLVERILTKVFGSYFTRGLGIVLLIGFLLMENTDYLQDFEKYKDYLFYGFIYFSFARIVPAKKIRPYLYLVFILLFIIEIMLIDKYKVFIGFHISLLILTYLILKGDIYEIGFEKYFLNGILYLFPLIAFVLDHILSLTSLNLYVSAGLIVLFIVMILYQIRFKIFDYVFLGIHRDKK